MAGWSEPRRRARLAEEAFRHVDLERGPLFRVTLFSDEQNRQIALIVLHHIVADFWSLAVLARELPALYHQEVTGVPAGLPPPGLPYEEQVRREVHQLAGERGEAAWRFWREELEGLPNLELTTDRPRPAIQTYRGDLRTRLLPAELAARLKAISRRRGATFFMTLVAAFQTLLLRHTGQEDLAIGSPTAGRHASGFAGTVGYFVNPVVLRGDLSGDPPFSELLARTRRRVIAAFEHQDYPLPLLAERLRPQRDASRTPLFQVSLVLQKEQRGTRGLAAFVLGQEGVPIELGDLQASSVRLDRPPTPFDLQLHVAETAGGLGLGLQLNTDLFDATTGEQLLARFEVLLRGIAESPDAVLSALPVLPEAERHQLLIGWNDTDGPGSECTLWELFAAQAVRTPEAVAVVFEGKQLTYSELSRCAAVLAGQLTALGVGPEVVVGVCEERSIELVVGLLAVLAAGGAYLPLEPSLPRERLATLLDDARPAVLLTRRSRLAELPVPPNVHVAWLDGAAEPLTRVEPVSSPARADHAAYLIYTSGSTGRPKGVVNRHRGIVNRLLWMQEAFSLGADDRVLQKTPFGFDVSVWEFFAPLVTGARLVVARPGGHQDPAYLAELVAREGVTTIHFVPSLLPVFLAEPGVAAACATLRRVVVSGEALPFEVEQRCLATLPAPLFDLYGPTEAAVEVTIWRSQPAPAPRPGPIGRPIRNTRIYLLDHPSFEPVPRGAPGELAIGGVQVARGYLGRPDLTAERFVPDPFSAEPGGRLYRTGDLSRHLAQGEIEFLGRIDHQVKIRGFRIEPQEIEAQLGNCPGVAEVVVVVRQESLLACVVPAGGTLLDPASLREHLAARLPAYMVPTGFAFLDRLPRLSNGKVDRKALALLAPLQLAESGGRAPRTPLEEILAGLFAEVLAVDRVGVEDGFFDLGGHSLSAMRLVARVREALGIELPVRTVFEASTVEALAMELERRTAPAAARPPLVRVPREAPLPLSFAQQRLWFLDRLEPGSPAYHMPAAVRLTGPLDRPALASAFSEVVRRHEILRTTFRVVDGEPVQVIAPDAAVPLPLVDLRNLPAGDRSRETERLSAAEALRPFDLERGPLLRTTLVAVEPEEHLLLVNLHHIVSDGWSLGVLVRELGAAFTHPLPELAIQSADFAVWQRRALSGAWLDAELAWWRSQLAGVPEALDLPTDRPRPAVLGSRGAVHPVVLDVGLADLARRQDATLFMVLLAGFAVLLSRHSGQDDLLLGTPVAGRTQVETEPLIGLFVNTLALRADLSGGPDFREVLRRVRETTLAAYAHQELPFERLVEEMAPERDLSRPPLVQAVLVLQNAPAAPLILPGLTLSAEQLPTGTAKFELTLTLTEIDGRLQGGLEYHRDLFDEATAARLADRLERLLAGAVATPERRIAELPLLSAAEQEQLLAWNPGTIVGKRPEETTLVALFEAAVARQPEAPAVRFEGKTVSYGELNDQAEALARRLVRSGVGPEVRVGVCLPRTPLLIASLLAVLKAGGAYVPLDPEYPRERLAFLLEDSGAAVLLAERDLAERCGPFAGVVVDPTDRTDGTDRSDPLPRVLPDHLAYVIYTSGSTGRPKGVLIRHGSVARLLRATEAWFGFGPSDVWTLFHSYAFDFSVWELWGALAYGGRLVVVPYWVSRSPEAFLRLLADEGVTVLNQTPSAFRELVQVEETTGPAFLALRFVIFGGEAVDLASLAPWIERHGDLSPRLINMYGITETTVHVTFRPLTSADLQEARQSPIGRAIPDLSLRLLGPEGELVPVGVAGEICVGGPGLARGYLGRPELTAERFVPDPYGSVPGGRLYRAGDLGRYRRDGEIDYLGRIDHQVKIRGFRIELGEIEAALLAHPAVQAAVVLLRPDLPGGSGLFACVAAEEGAVSAAGLRSFLQERLPDYMLPAAYAFLPALPLTENGKVDRRALARLRPEREAAGGGAPRTPEEEIVAGIFAQVLGIGPPAREEDFFALGGHSLLATQVVARIHSLFGVDLPVRAVFEASTVAGLAARIGPSTQPEAIPRISREGPLVLSFAQQRLWFLDQMEPGSPAYNIPLQARLSGRIDRAALAAAFSALVRRHETLRTAFANVQGEPVPVISPRGGVELPEIDLQALPAAAREREASRLARDEARRPFDLGRGPLLRAILLTLAPDESLLILDLHHIVSDGWSMGVLVRELGTLYGGSPLPELPIQYADYAAWQRRRLSGADLDREISWWREQLRGLPAALDLPTDHPRPTARSLRGALHPFAIDRETSAGLGRLARQHGATLFMTLLAGFAALLSRLAGEDDLAVGTPVAGRTRVETEPLIGLFVNTLALRAGLSGDPEIAELLGRVRETTLAAYAHQELPFERLVEALVPERDLSRPPLLQVMLVLQNAPAAPLELPGLTISVAPLDTGTSKLELTLLLTETGQGLAGSLEYSLDLFEEATAARLAERFVRLLSGVVADPRLRVSDLPLLSEAERRQLLVTYNEVGTVPVPEVGLHQLFEAQAARTPEATALIAGASGERWTYAELDARAEALARRLIQAGVGPEARVGVCLSRTPRLVASLLAVLKAGGVYVPLDPDYPRERLAFLLEDSGAAVLMTEAELAGRCGPFGGVVVEVTRTDRTDPTDRSELHPPLPGSLAYLIYTSGSTGRPKGVAIEHRSAVAFACWARTAFSDEELAGVLASTSVSFDLSVFELFVPLAWGGTVVLAANALELPRLAAEVRLVNTVPSAMAELVRTGGLPASVRTVNLAGEPLSRALVDAIFAARPGVRVLDLYGPSEATTYSTWAPARPEERHEPAIGRAIAGTRVVLLGRQGELVPAGVAGELLLGGAGLARGYLGRPDLTAERFVPESGGRRLYRTGDLARWRPDGRLEYLGRIDHQVKVRGFRIELGEIEATLRLHPGVSAAAVVARPDKASLLAAVVTRGILSAAELRSFLRERLPEHMVPSSWAFLAELPLTANGKVDRKILARLQPDREAPAPVRQRTPAEEKLAGLVAEVLGLERVEGDDDFFALGGDSLQATRLAARVLSAFGVELPVRTIFKRPTVAGLAGMIERAARKESARAEPIPRRARPGPLPFENPTGPIQVAVRLRGRLDRQALATALAEVERRHEILPSSGCSALVPIGTEEHLLHLTLPDGWSLGVLLRDLGTLYAGSPLPELPIQYADYAAWHQERLSGSFLETERAWWRDALTGIPADHPAREPGASAVHGFSVDVETTRSLASLARRHGATLFMALLAGFATLLSRLTGRDDLVIGTLAAGRTRVETEPLIGPFARVLPLRVRLSGNPDVAELLERARETTLAALAHPEVPAEQLVPLQALLVFHNAIPGPPACPGLELEIVPHPTGTSKHEMTWTLAEAAEGLTGTVEYDRGLFDEATIARLARDFQEILRQLE